MEECYHFSSELDHRHDETLVEKMVDMVIRTGLEKTKLSTEPRKDCNVQY